MRTDSDNVISRIEETDMFTRLFLHTSTGILISFIVFTDASAKAASPLTFVSGQGNDTGTCASPATPCRTFQFAYGQTSSGGEIKARSPGDFGPLTIAKSISITGIEGAGIHLAPSASASAAVNINAGAADTINLSYLTFDGSNAGQDGIFLQTGGTLTVNHCVVRNFKRSGIGIVPAGSLKFLIADTLLSGISSSAILVAPRGAGSTQGTIDRALAYNSGEAIGVTGSASSGAAIDVSVVNTVATKNSYGGFGAFAGAFLRLAHSTSTGNGVGVTASGGTVESAGDNFINGNGTDVQGTLTPLPTR